MDAKIISTLAKEPLKLFFESIYIPLVVFDSVDSQL